MTQSIEQRRKPYKSDWPSEVIIFSKLSVRSSFQPRTFVSCPPSGGSFRKSHESSRMSYSDLHLAYQFTWICGDTYRSRANRRLSQRMSKGIPQLLATLMSQNTVSSCPDRDTWSSIARYSITITHNCLHFMF